MNLEQFIRLLDTFGADFRRWPDAQRVAGEALLDASPAAREKWEAAQRLDALFTLDRRRLEQTVRADSGRTAAITDAALRQIRARPTRSWDWRWLFSKPVGAILAATALAGWLAGVVISPAWQSSPQLGVPAVALLLGYGAAGIEEWL
ncbi:hypothetical protein [Shumkonia mesophila]|uniref:hypothetical protein n=1 Tax=Shumkonia mesophila TaxID=2838854 RepID=UPI002934778D|nr:hypothetical protein [Shumkonia mesophila]